VRAGRTGARPETTNKLKWLARAAACVVVVGVSPGCTGDDSEPFRLMDGSEPPEISVEVEGVPGPMVLTRVRTLQGSAPEPESLTASCLRDRLSDARPRGTVVERIGIFGESVTFRAASGREFVACDNSLGPRERDLRWCGGAHGLLYDGRLRDPRLSIVCHMPDRQPMGFAWIQPAAGVRYVALIEPDYTEVYPVAGSLPIRVATASGAEIEGSRATFEISEHDASGRLLRKYRLEAAVAG
jgi:hypothetical protein